MPADPGNTSALHNSMGSGEASISSSGNQFPLYKETVKKKRNLPGMPDPDAEVVALSPNTLLATNRFVCEICNKGFQRDQNLQLHRRGHNLPWKLRQRTSKEVKKRVYICPEPTCVHHDPSRALGDLTGIKKHFSRKHGEKKWKCEKCSKKYAVQSDLKAHIKICGTKEYRCECGTMFSRRDSFLTHRAFCDVLAKDGEKAQLPVTAVNTDVDPKVQAIASPSPPPTPPAPPPASKPASPSVLPPAGPEPLPPPVPPSIAQMSPESLVDNPESESPCTNSTATTPEQVITTPEQVITTPEQVMEETAAVANMSGICSSTSSSNVSTSTNSFSRMTGICSSSSIACSKRSTTSSSLFACPTGISSSSSTFSSIGSTTSDGPFACPIGVSSSTTTSFSNGSTTSSSIFASQTGICSALNGNGTTNSSNLFACPTGIGSNRSTVSSSSFPSSAGICSSSSSVVASPTGICSSSSTSSNSGSTTTTSTFASLFASSTASGSFPSQAPPPQFTDWFQSMHPEPPAPDVTEPQSSLEPISLCLAMNHGSSIFGQDSSRRQYAQPSMSATALLQKAAQMGATSTNSSSLLRGLGMLSASPSSNGQHEWSAGLGLGLGLPCDDGSGLKELMLGTPSVFGPKHPTLDLLGLGMAAGGGPTPGFSALITSMGGNLDVGGAAGSFSGSDFCGKELGSSS